MGNEIGSGNGIRGHIDHFPTPIGTVELKYLRLWSTESRLSRLLFITTCKPPVLFPPPVLQRGGRRDGVDRLNRRGTEKYRGRR